MSQLVDDLKAVRRLLRANKRWTKHAWARRPTTDLQTGRVRHCVQMCTTSDPLAECWCLDGAIEKVLYYSGPSQTDTDHFVAAAPREDAVNDAIKAALPKWANNYIPAFNDNTRTTHEKLLRFLDRVIKRAEKEASK